MSPGVVPFGNGVGRCRGRAWRAEVHPMTSTRDTLRVGNLMTLDPIVIAPDEPAAEAERLMKTFRISGLPVVDKDELAGVVSQADLIVARSSEMIGAHWERIRVRHLMTSPAI